MLKHCVRKSHRLSSVLSRLLMVIGIDVLFNFLQHSRHRSNLVKYSRGTNLVNVSRVVIAKNVSRNLKAAIEKSLNLINDFKNLITSDSAVLVKPNMGFSNVDANTDPRVIIELVKLIKNNYRPRKIVVADAAVRGRDTLYNFTVMNLKNKLEKLGVLVIDLKRTKETLYVRVNGIKLRSVKVYKTVLDFDVVLSVPKLKRHAETKVTISLKNMMGILPDDEKGRFHVLDIHSCIADLNKVFKPDISIIDAINVMIHSGPGHGDMVYADELIISKDPVAADLIAAAELFKLEGVMNPLDEALNIEHIIKACQLGIGHCDLNRIEIKELKSYE